MSKTDIIIIGAGVIGLAVAARLAGRGNVAVIEKEASFGQGVSSRNSEVIHAGLYYPSDFLRTKLCVRGSKLLYEYCRKNDVPHKRIGKLVVAIKPEEAASIENLFSQAQKNGVEDLSLIGKTEIKKIEPNVNGVLAIHSPNTGIIDTHGLMKSLEARAVNSGVHMLYKTEMTGIEKISGGFKCHAENPQGAYDFKTRILINCAGLFFFILAGMAGIDVDSAGYRIHPVKGEYFRVAHGKHKLVNGLVYPSPEKGLTGLGIHVTKNLEGYLRLGPNTVYDGVMDFSVDAGHGQQFYEGAKEMLPFIELSDLEPDTAGLRPKIQALGEPVKDFIIRHESDRELEGLINLIGIESPGLTSCLAIAETVEKTLTSDGLLK